MRVLLIEDETNIVEALRFVMMREGWEVATHSNGDTALEAVSRHAPDVVVLDVMLPGRSGYDILTGLRALEATAALPVLMLTARGQRQDRDRAARAGADHYMSKPFDTAELLGVLRGLGPE